MQPSQEHDAQTVTARIDAFVRANFRLAGTLRLHRAALGWDLLRAPLNVMLAPLHLLVMLMGLCARMVGLHRLGRWLASRQLLMKTAVARELELRLLGDLLQGAPLSPQGLARLDAYCAVRSAIAEITTSLFVLCAGLALFGSATPGIMSLAPRVSDYFGHASAVAAFPLGAGLGGLWYGVFPVALPVWFVIATGVALAMTGALVTTFAGIIADPVQALVGIHRRRLARLLEALARIDGNAAGIAPEHILARLADLTDAGISLVRLLRS
ncbi:hypothetical protein Q4543_14760 [Salipiger sp. 1_MG-2023]|uniref:DUF6635 family protein n=1 Tax=Salipiger sp. 1_MG-2023 TaxID=3062665 RepID=UPI0026E1461C|nr:DUF6635 family protein [Salipiger sp. 1_MG-2023]MDO6586774.1 hypothetical protein [Salipiger sp. 1_MG-2023]